MVHLPPPPRFTLPPPPMLSSDIFDTKLLFRLSCSSIRQQRQQQQMINSRLIVFSCVSLGILLLFTLLFIIIQFRRRRKSSLPRPTSHSLPALSSTTNSSMTSSQSYATISSGRTDHYVKSIDTSTTTYSTEPSNIICLSCQDERQYSTIAAPPPYYHTLDILPS